MDIFNLLEALARMLPHCEFMVSAYPNQRIGQVVEQITIGIRGKNYSNKIIHMKQELSRVEAQGATPEAVAHHIKNQWVEVRGKP